MITIYDLNSNKLEYENEKCTDILNFCSAREENGCLYYIEHNYLATFEELKECCHNEKCSELNSCSILDDTNDLNLICCIDDIHFLEQELPSLENTDILFDM